jgi:hypothetical protein
VTWVIVGAVGALLSIAVPVIVLVLIVRAGRHGRSGAASPGSPVRRFFQYGLMAVALVMAAVGFDMLTGTALESDGMIVRGSGRVAWALALVLVGGPLFTGLAVWTRRRMDTDPGERLSIGWLLYATGVSVGSLVVAAVAISESIARILGVGASGRGVWVTAVVWSAVWAGHWAAARRRVPADESRSHRLLGSLLALGGLMTTVIALGGAVLTWMYRELLSDTLASTIGRDVREIIGPLAVAAAAWWWYWLRTTRRQEPTVGWNAYVLLGGVLGGLIVVVVTAGIVVFAVLQWLVGDPGGVGAVDHFAVLPAVLFAGAVGAASWRYHRDVLRSGSAGPVDEVARIYTYLLAGVGLIAGAVGLTTLVRALIELMTRGRAIGGSSADVALIGLTLLVVGVPLWWSAWSSVHRSSRDPAEERSSLARRLYLSGSFGLGSVVTVVALLGVLARSLQDLIDGSLGSATLDAVRYQVALVVTVGAIAAYHWRVFRADRAFGPGRLRTLERLVLVAPGDAAALGRVLAERTGARVEVWRSDGEDPDGGAPADRVAEAVASLSGSEGAVIVHRDGRVEVVDARRIV